MAFEALKKRHATIWSSAPFEGIADIIADMHGTLVDSLDPREGERWLDAACGTGNVAFLAARAGAEVTGCDIAPGLVETARTSAAAQGLTIAFEVADAEQLPYADGSFDVVSSSVGVIFAPDHPQIAAELARVVRPGGRLGLTAWRASGGVFDLFRTMAPFAPPPVEGAGSPFQWGDEAYAEKHLGAAFDLRFTEHDTPWMGDDPAEMWDFFHRHYGPSHTIRSGLDDDRKQELDAAMIAVLEASREDRIISQSRRYIVISGTRR